MSLTDTARAAATERLHLRDFTPDDVRDSIRGEGPNVHPNRLWSEDLTSAHNSVRATGNDDLIESFEDTAATLLSGSYAQDGFDTRASVGQAVNIMLDSGDTRMFDKLLKGPLNVTDDVTLAAQLKALKAELKGEVSNKGLEVHSTYEPPSRANAPGLKKES